MNNLKYGAVYYPWLKTTLPFKVDYNAIVGGTYTKGGSPVPDITALFNSGLVSSINSITADIAAESTLTVPVAGIVNNRANLVTEANNLYNFFKDIYDLKDAPFSDNDISDPNSAASVHAKLTAENSNFHNLLKTLCDYNHFSQSANSDAPSPAWDDALITNDFATDFNTLTFSAPVGNTNNIFKATNTAASAAPYFAALLGKLKALKEEFYAELKAVRKNRTELLLEVDPVYKGIANAIDKKGVVLPPSGAVVGVYAAVDNDRGVWKAPANVSLTAVRGPSVNITHHDQESLNIDSEAGKSVNAIRSFTGKGTMIWGARTLAGNDNEWKYIPVRRFFNMVEESVKKATAQFVFEPNDANTWVKVRAMIENFLMLQWRAGALAGAKPDDAFYVRVGLGQTMTAQDVLKGYMNVEIGMAVVRPAEFIILKFSHKLQQS
jgi:hypothetical protein